MMDFKRLFELLDEADHAADCNCRTTTMAYLRLAAEEWFRQVEDGRSQDERQRLTEAALYIDALIKRFRSPSKAARIAYDFWSGFESGWNRRTLPQRTNPSFRRGFRFGERKRE